MDRPLVCVVTGMVGSGTTFLSQSMCRRQGVSCGFECGVLLGRSPREFPRFEPYYSWMMGRTASGHWGLTREQRGHCCDTDSFPEFYWRLAAASPIVGDGDRLIDKTPHYVYVLDRVMARVDAPVLVIDKDILLLYRSARARTRSRHAGLLSLAAFVRAYLAYRRNLGRWRAHRRVRVVEHTDLVRRPDAAMDEVCRFIGIEGAVVKPMEYKHRPLRPSYDIDAEMAQADRGLRGFEKRLLRAIEYRPDPASPRR